jgi:hypothetical protein
MITFMTAQTGEIWLYSKRIKAQHELRIKVEDFINQEVGAEQVISITELKEGFNLFVTVWYHTGEGTIRTHR